MFFDVDHLKLCIEFVTIFLLFYVPSFFGGEVCRILAPQSGIEPIPPGLEGKVLTTGPPKEVLLFLRAGLLVRWSVWVLPRPCPQDTQAMSCHCYWLQGPSSAQGLMSTALEAGDFCGPSYLGSQWVQGERWSWSLPFLEVHSNLLSLSKCLWAPLGQDRHSFVRTRGVIHRQEMESRLHPVVNQDEWNAV